MYINNINLKLNNNLELFFFHNNSKLYLKHFSRIFFISLPSFYFYSFDVSRIKLLFLSKFLFKSVLANFTTLYKSLFFFNFSKLKIKGLGFRIRYFCDSLCRFFFGSTNYIYFHVPAKICIKIKKKCILLVSNELNVLRIIMCQLLLLKRLLVYNIRGLIRYKSIFFLKVGKQKS